IIMDLPGRDPEAEAAALSDAVEIIRWYQYQIYVKLARALSGKDEEREESAGYPSNADGSAKVVLIGVQNSLAAWARLREHLSGNDSILDMLVDLERI